MENMRKPSRTFELNFEETLGKFWKNIRKIIKFWKGPG